MLYKGKVAADILIKTKYIPISDPILVKRRPPALPSPVSLAVDKNEDF
jgi:hypothetical protein